MGRCHGKMQTFILLTLWAALTAGGCGAPAGTGDRSAAAPVSEAGSQAREKPGSGEDTADAEHNPPSYVYYIKDADLMRVDVNGRIEAGKNPSLVMADAGENVNLKDYYDVSLAGDGSYLVFKFEMDKDIFGDHEKLIAVNNEDGTSELLYEGYAYTFMCGNKLLYQIEHTSEDLSDTRYDLYSYTLDQGKKLEIADMYNFYPSKDGSVICFTRMDEEQNQKLYRYEDGEEVLLSDDMNFSYASEDYSRIYVDRTVQEEETFYYELLKLGKDGAKETILAKDDHGAGCYPDPENDGLYYIVYGEEGVNSLYYTSDGDKKLLSDEVSMVWESIEGSDCLDGKTMLVYLSGPAGKKNLYAAVGGTVSEFMVPDFPENWLDEYYKNITVSGDNVYLTATELSDSHENSKSWIYRYKLSAGRLGSTPECAAQGTDLYLIGEKAGKTFYTDGISDKRDLYCDGVRILDGVYGETVCQVGSGDGEYFVFQEKGGAAPDLMRITTAGSSKVFRENVVQCEPYGGGLLFLSDCRDSYPYLGTLSFYNVSEIKVIDEDVTVFFQHDENQFIDAVPRDWDWSGQDWSSQDSHSEAYMEGTTFFNAEYGFSIDLEENVTLGNNYEINNDNENSVSLICYDEEGNERYDVTMTEAPPEAYEGYREHDNAAAYGQWMQDMYNSTMKEYGYEEEKIVVEKTEDILLDGRKAIKLIIRTENGLLTNKSMMIRYLIPDEDNSRMLQLTRQFLAGLEKEEDIEAYQMCVESLKWDPVISATQL